MYRKLIQKISITNFSLFGILSTDPPSYGKSNEYMQAKPLTLWNYIIKCRLKFFRAWIVLKYNVQWDVFFSFIIQTSILLFIIEIYITVRQHLMDSMLLPWNCFFKDLYYRKLRFFEPCFFPVLIILISFWDFVLRYIEWNYYQEFQETIFSSKSLFRW